MSPLSGLRNLLVNYLGLTPQPTILSPLSGLRKFCKCVSPTCSYALQSQSTSTQSVSYPAKVYNPIIHEITWDTAFQYPSNDSSKIKDVFVINNKGNVGIGTNEF